MDTYNKHLGTKRILGFFPTITVSNKILRDLNIFWDHVKINNMYLAYKEAVLDKGMASYPGNNGEVVPYIVQETGYERNDVWIFLVSLIELVEDGKIDEKFLNIELQKGTLIDKVEGALPDPITLPNIEGVITALKWVGVVAAVGLGLYLVRPILKMATK